MFDELVTRLLKDSGRGRPSSTTWAFLTGDGSRCEYLVDPKAFRPLMKLRREETAVVRGERLNSWAELQELMEDDSDPRTVTLIDILGSQAGLDPPCGAQYAG